MQSPAKMKAHRGVDRGRSHGGDFLLTTPRRRLVEMKVMEMEPRGADGGLIGLGDTDGPGGQGGAQR